MTPISTLLIFDLDGAYFGLDATLVHEMLWLPELTPVEEAPFYIIGLFSLRDQLIPVADLSLRFGHPARHCNINDQVVVLEQNQLLIGLIVSEVHEVIDMPHTAIQPAPEFDLETHHHASLVAGEMRMNDNIVTLLDMSQLANLPQNLMVTDSAQPLHHFCPEATPEQRAIYHARACALQNTLMEEDGVRLALAVVALNDEYFGIELESVQEFCEITHPSPIPCCPQHILGAINLRGNLFTLLDLRTALNLPQAMQSSNKVVIARASTCFSTDLGEQMVGLAVDDVHDIIYLRQEELQTAPAVLREQHGVEIKGTASYAGKIMVVLDLPALLARQEWIVNESVLPN